MSDTERAALIAEIEVARGKIANTGTALREAGEGLRRRFDVPSRAKLSFEKHRPAWLGGAAILGLLLAKLPARKKTVFIELLCTCDRSDRQLHCECSGSFTVEYLKP